MEAEDSGDPVVAEEPIEIKPIQPAEAKLTVEEATARIGEKALLALQVKFNGQLTQVRPSDNKDLFF